MKLVKTALVASILLPAAVGCLEDNSGQDTTSGSTSGSVTSDSTASGTTTTTTMGGMGGSGPATTTGAMDTTGTTSAGGSGSTTDSASAGGTGAGGTAGTGALDPDTLIPGLDGLFWAFRTMNENDPGDFKYWLTGTDEECPTGDWATAGTTVSKEFQVMGTPGEQYTINFELRGALSLRCYTDGTPTGMTPDAAGINEAFYVGGQQFGDSPVNTLELVVSPDVAGATANNYFLNGIPSTSDMCDTGITYDVQYQAQFVVMGDSMITMGTHASDCQALQNCGADPGGAGCDPRIVDVEGVQVKASPAQPISDYLGGIEFFPQWLVLDIQSITSP